MKKYLIIAAAAALTLASCAKIETYTSVDNELKPIAFTNYAPKALAKANASFYAAGNTLIENAQFGVWGWSTNNGTAFAGTGTDFFANWYTVIYQSGGNTTGSSNDYTTDGLRYWPSGDTPKWLSFCAYYPKNGSGINPPDAGLGEYTFTAQTSAATMVDFMVSDVVADQTYDTRNSNPGTNSGTDGTVALTFRHMLTKVVFQFKKSDVDAVVTVTGASLSGIFKTNTLTTSYNGTATDAYDASKTVKTWGTANTEQTYTVAIPAAALTTTAVSSGNDANDIFLMVPQTIAADQQKLTISWTVQSGSDPAIPNEATVDLYDMLDSSSNHINWAKNQYVIYTITVGPHPIYFTATVAGWDGPTNGFYTVD